MQTSGKTPTPRNCISADGGYTETQARGALPNLAVERGQKALNQALGQGRE